MRACGAPWALFSFHGLYVRTRTRLVCLSARCFFPSLREMCLPGERKQCQPWSWSNVLE
jgi:hypothetical protein